MFRFKSVKTKLASISALTIIGFATLLIFILYYSSSQSKFITVQNYSKELQNSITQLEFISKQKAVNTHFFEQMKTVQSNFSTLKEAMIESSLDLNTLNKLNQKLQTAKKSYEKVYDNQQQIEKYLDKMAQSKNKIKQIFEKEYDYKLIQYMMKLELAEMKFINSGIVDLDEFAKTQFKMRRSVRGSINFTTNKPLQKEITQH
jgi:hypothetical protein